MRKPILRFISGSLGALAVSAVQTQGAPFTYNPQDLLLGFRNSGTNDFLVDVGPASSFYNAAPGSSFALSGYSGAQLSTVMGGLDGLSFSVFGDVRTSGGAKPLNTLWTARASADLNTQSDPWNRASQFSQANPGAKIDGIANGGVTYSGVSTADPNSNTATAVAVPDSWNASGTSYTIGIGAAGNFAGTFQGSVENSTPAGFASSGSPLRSDLYELDPGTGPGSFLGYFELGTDGTMTFTAVPEPSTWALVMGGFAVLLMRNRVLRKA